LIVYTPQWVHHARNVTSHYFFPVGPPDARDYPAIEGDPTLGGGSGVLTARRTLTKQDAAIRRLFRLGSGAHRPHSPFFIADYRSKIRVIQMGLRPVRSRRGRPSGSLHSSRVVGSCATLLHHQTPRACRHLLSMPLGRCKNRRTKPCTKPCTPGGFRAKY
jgi:hypothetical protein